MSHSQHDWPLVHGHCVPCLLEKAARDAREIRPRDILKKLAEWADAPHGAECAGIVCRHARARQAIVEVGNAIAELEWEKKKCPECHGGGEIGLADGEIACPTCGGSGDEKDPGPFKIEKKVTKQ